MPFTVPSEPVLRRGVALQGGDALEWLAARGSRIVDRRDLSLVTDELTRAGFRLARLWHTSAAAELSVAEGSVLLVVPVEGRAAVSSAGGKTDVGLVPGDVLVLCAGPVTTTAADTAIARFEIAVEASMIPAPLRGLIGSHAVLPDVPPGFRAALISAANATLNSDLDVRSQGIPELRLAFSHLAVAIVTAGLDRASAENLSLRGHALYRRAREVITRRSNDPQFGVEALARELSISERYLHRVFSSVGSSPAAEIREARALVARSYDGGDAGTLLTASERARFAGFTNATAMRRALRRTGSVSR